MTLVYSEGNEVTHEDVPTASLRSRKARRPPLRRSVSSTEMKAHHHAYAIDARSCFRDSPPGDAQRERMVRATRRQDIEGGVK